MHVQKYCQLDTGTSLDAALLLNSLFNLKAGLSHLRPSAFLLRSLLPVDTSMNFIYADV